MVIRTPEQFYGPKPFWSGEEVREIARERGFLLAAASGAEEFSLGSIETALPGLTREQVAEALRVLFAIPGDDGEYAHH